MGTEVNTMPKYEIVKDPTQPVEQILRLRPTIALINIDTHKINRETAHSSNNEPANLPHTPVEIKPFPII